MMDNDSFYKKWALQRGWKYTGAFDSWVLRHNIGPGMNDRHPGIKNYTGNDGRVGEGWIPLLDQLATELRAMGWDGSLSQVKEKFGTLRFYANVPHDSEMQRRIDQAERDSARICENCGDLGKLRGENDGRHWLNTLCDECDRTVNR